MSVVWSTSCMATVFHPISVAAAFPEGAARDGSGPFPEPPLYWGMNGLFSVVGSMATMVTAVIFGFTWAMLGGALFYLVAALSSRVLSAHPRGA